MCFRFIELDCTTCRGVIPSEFEAVTGSVETLERLRQGDVVALFPGHHTSPLHTSSHHHTQVLHSWHATCNTTRLHYQYSHLQHHTCSNNTTRRHYQHTRTHTPATLNSSSNSSRTTKVNELLTQSVHKAEC